MMLIFLICSQVLRIFISVVIDGYWSVILSFLLFCRPLVYIIRVIMALCKVFGSISSFFYGIE